MFKVRTVGVGIALGIMLATPLLAGAQTVDELQAQLASLVARLNAVQAGQSSTASSSSLGGCTFISQNLSLGSTGPDVTALQQFLVARGLLSSDAVTGVFGLSTQTAVQSWQASNNIVASGSPSTTGWGVVGPRTRQVMANCPSTNTTTNTNTSTNTNTASNNGGCPAGTVQSPYTAASVVSCIAVTITINQSSLTSTSPTPTINGSANGYTAIMASIADNSGTVVVAPSTLHVTNGYWSATSPVALAPGNYLFRAGSPTIGSPGTVSGTLIVLAASSTATTTTTASTAPFVSVTAAPVAISPGRTLSISWRSLNAPGGAAVALWLTNASNNKSGLIASQLDSSSATSTYPWTIPALNQTCPADTVAPCNILAGTYFISAELYTPSNATFGAMLANPVAKTTQATATSNSFAISAQPLPSACLSISNNLGPGDTDQMKNGDVSSLQSFLALDPSIYPEGLVSGYYGPATVAAVKRWQSAHGVVSAGSPDTTGYGAVGPATRAAMAADCGNSSVLSATPRTGKAPLSVAFTGTAPGASYSLDFGDGTPVIGRATQVDCAANAATCALPTTIAVNQTHLYAAPGTYVAKLTGASGQVIGSVSVNITSQTSLTSCAAITNNLYPEDTDLTTGGDVSRLQQFLANSPSIYPEGLVTGYYGPATIRAVQRYQAAQGIVSSGTPETTGYGAVGARTRASMLCNTGVLVATPSTGGAPLSTTLTITLAPGTYTLDFGDGSAAASETLACAIAGCATASTTVQHSYAVNGTYNARLYTSTGNCSGFAGDALSICLVGQTNVLGSAQIVVSGTGGTGSTGMQLYTGTQYGCNLDMVTGNAGNLNCPNTPIGHSLAAGSSGAQTALYQGTAGNCNAGAVTTDPNFRGCATTPFGYSASGNNGGHALYTITGSNFGFSDYSADGTRRGESFAGQVGGNGATGPSGAGAQIFGCLAGLVVSNPNSSGCTTNSIGYTTQ